MAVAGSRLVGFERYRALEARTCFYSVAEDERFVVEPRGRAWLLAGFSGHGFKFGAVIGEAVAEALAGRRAGGDGDRLGRRARLSIWQAPWPLL